MGEPVVIGVTGNIATGKSVVLQMLARQGAVTIDADRLVHQILNRDAAVQSEIAARFGAEVRAADGTIDRPRLAATVFQDPSALHDLEAIIHPRVGREVDRLIRESTAPAVVIEAIKLLESGLRDRCRSIWVTTCPQELQIERLVALRRMTRKQAVARIQSQPSQATKVAMADVVIDTSGRLEETETQVERAWRNLQRRLGGNVEPAGPVTLRRAKPRDVGALAALIDRARTRMALDPAAGDQPMVDRSQLLASLGEHGYLLAEVNGEIVGAAAWNAENLIAHVRQVILVPHSDAVGRALLEAVCQSAHDLMCEVALLYGPADVSEQAMRLYRACDFQPAALEELTPAWRDAARGSLMPGGQVMVRRLREKRLLRPV